MKIAYFPFTFVPLQLSPEWLRYFPKLHVYAPIAADSTLNAAETNDRIVVTAPCPENSRQVEQLYKVYQQWQMSHAGISSAYARTVAGKTPFFDETTISYLKQDIRQALATENQRDEADPLLSAQLFLRFTHDHDRQQRQIDDNLRSLEVREKKFLDELKGETADSAAGDAAAPGAAWPEDPGTYLTAERLRAWSVLAGRDSAPPDVLVTDSQAVWEHLQEVVPDLELVVTGDPPPASDAPGSTWPETLHRFCEDLANVQAAPASPLDPPAATTGWRWQIGRILSMSTADLLSFLAAGGRGKDSAAKDRPSAQKAAVVIGLQPVFPRP